MLKTKQRIALNALAFGENPRLVAARAEVSLRTLYRWRSDPDLREALHTALEDYHGNFPQEEAAARILAFHALAETARWSSPSERTRAATTLLAYLERRISAKNLLENRR
jgi:HD-like signal output (HDOD) protein